MIFKSSDRKKRILFLISRFLDGGIDTILVEYLQNIPLDQYDVTLAVGVKMDELEVHLKRIPEGVKVEYLVDSPSLTRIKKAKIKGRVGFGLKLWDELALNPLRKAQSAWRLGRLKQKADAIIDFDSTFYSSLKGTRQRPVTGFYHFSIAENLRRSKRHTRRQMEGMAAYDHIALISDAMVDEGLQLFPDLARKFVRIYNGYNLQALRQRGDAPLPADVSSGSYLVAVERLEESQKDISTLLKAFAQTLINPEFTRIDALRPAPLRLKIVGTGRDRSRLERLAQDLGIADRVDFLGFQPDAAPWIANSLALVHSSKYEGFGLVLAEALILGRAVAATDCPSGPAEVLDYGRAGMLIPVGDEKVMSRVMTLLASDPVRRAELEAAALKRAEDFNIQKSVNQLLSICFKPNQDRASQR